ncbi:hypothetical protein NE865_01716 [Phthorimaea operculella]|nr:hypothetical protein NE865_01716 [Phthorimaea operculella]
MPVLFGYFPTDPVERTTALGCKLLLLLQEMYGFRMQYAEGSLFLKDNRTFDIYAQPIALSPYLLDHGYPIEAIINRRYGWITLQSLESFTAHAFFALPFANSTWYSVLLMIFFMTPLLYIFGQWEKTVVGAIQEYSLVYELMVVLGACFQHIPPTSPMLMSRRIAYLFLFIFSWMIYTYYSSNLLSHLVNDKVGVLSAEELAMSGRPFLALDTLQLRKASTGLTWYSSAYIYTLPRFNMIRERIMHMKSANISAGLRAISTQNAAFLSDFVTVYPFIKKYLNNEDICSLVEVNLFSGLKEYVYTSKTFPMKKEFRIGVLKIKEFGLIQRIKQARIFYSRPQCDLTPQTHACFEHIMSPLILLACAFVVSAILLFIERAYYERTRRNDRVN